MHGNEFSLISIRFVCRQRTVAAVNQYSFTLCTSISTRFAINYRITLRTFVCLQFGSHVFNFLIAEFRISREILMQDSENEGGRDAQSDLLIVSTFLFSICNILKSFIVIPLPCLSSTSSFPFPISGRRNSHRPHFFHMKLR
jgi:hypothetical protein